MNILYITFVDIKDEESIGVEKKIRGQIKGIKENGNDVMYTFCENNIFNMVDNLGNKKEICKFKGRLDKRLRMYNKKIIDIIREYNIDIIYMRYALSDMLFILFLKKIKKLKVKIYLEIPTYPYDKDISKKKMIIDKIFRQFMCKYVDKVIISSSKVDKVFNIESIFIDNCVDVDNIKYKEHKYFTGKESIELLAVSFFRYSNGYDRLIMGLSEYYNKNNSDKIIKLRFIGKGEEEVNLKNMVDEYNLNNYVYFEGVKTDEELDAYFECADIAIGALGDHRVGIKCKAPLKSREYCARGIPFISSIKDPGFKGNEDFILTFTSNDSPIDIYKIIKFYESLICKENISKTMRDYAYENFDWKIKYKNLFEIKN